MERRHYLRSVGAVTAGGVLAGCVGDDGSNGGADDENDTEESVYGTLSTSVTDQPNDIGDFESLVVTIDGIWIKPSEDTDTEDEETDDGGESDEEETEENGGDESDPDEETDDDADEEEDADDEEEDGDDDAEEEEDADVDESEGRRYIEFEEPQQADLVELQGDNTQLIDETDVEVGEYEFLQLNVSDTEGILTDGEEAEVRTPGNAPLQFKHSFEIRAEERTRFIADFAPNKTGPQGYIIRPVASGVKVLYGDEEYDGGDADDADSDDDTDEDGTADDSTDGTADDGDDGTADDEPADDEQ